MTEAELLEIVEQQQERQAKFRCRVFCCNNTGCQSSGAVGTFEALKQAAQARNLTQEVDIVPCGCLGLCSRGPLVRVEQAGQEERLFQQVTRASAARVLASAVGETEATELRLPLAQPFFQRQLKIVLENAGHIQPESLEDYIARGGYSALAKTLEQWTPQETCDALVRSGLRGRGGAGYPTGVKWNLVRKATSPTRHVIANGDEGDPGAYMDRTVMEDDPHRVLEGMIIAGYAVGAQQGYLYVRGEYPLAIQRLEGAIKQAQRRGVLGKSVLETKFTFNLEIRIGAGAFVCGEETALIASVEGNRGLPRPRPPFPAEAGLHGCPTLINNVETFANVPTICRRGPEWFASIGTEKSKGTKVFALAGSLVNTGLIEVPMGTTLRDIVYNLGGGMTAGRTFKAVQTGGPSGGCIPEQLLDLPVDYESLQQAGSIMGSGGMIVVDDTANMVDFARFFMEFCRDESCGKCIPCRVGTVQMHNLLDSISKGTATLDDLELLEELCDMVRATSLCGLGQTAPNPVLSTLRFFRQEYLSKIGERRRPAGPAAANGLVSLPLIS